jgi:hypothetical protein
MLTGNRLAVENGQDRHRSGDGVGTQATEPAQGERQGRDMQRQGRPLRLGLGAKFTLTVLTILACTMAANTLYSLYSKRRTGRRRGKSDRRQQSEF